MQENEAYQKLKAFSNNLHYLDYCMRLHTTSMKNFQIVIFNLLFNTILIIPALSKESKGMFFFLPLS